MFRLLRQLLMFRIGQKASKAIARKLGMRWAAPLIGIIGGVKHMRRHA